MDNMKSTITERGDHWHPDPEKDKKLGGPGANQRAREDRAAASKPKSDPKKRKSGESYIDSSKRHGYKKSPPKVFYIILVLFVIKLLIEEFSIVLFT